MVVKYYYVVYIFNNIYGSQYGWSYVVSDEVGLNIAKVKDDLERENTIKNVTILNFQEISKEQFNLISDYRMEKNMKPKEIKQSLTKDLPKCNGCKYTNNKKFLFPCLVCNRIDRIDFFEAK